MAWPSGTADMVDERFYAPQPTAFTMTKSNTGMATRYAVRNSIGETVMQAERARIGNNGGRSVLIVDPALRRPLITLVDMTRKAWERRWEAFRGQSTSVTDRHFVAVDRSRYFQKGFTLHVFLDGNSSSGDRAPDFFVHCSYRGPMTVSRGGSNVARIGRETNRGGSYGGLPEEEAGGHTYTITGLTPAWTRRSSSHSPSSTIR